MRGGLEQALQGLYEPVVTVGTLHAALERLQVGGVSRAVLVLDPPLVDASLREACDRLISAFPDVRVLVLLQRPTAHSVYTVLTAGAQGVYCSDLDIPDLHQVLRKIDAGNIQVQSSLIQYLVDPPRGADRDSPSIRLTEREQEIFRLFAQGWTSKQIAARYGITPKAIDMAVERACRRIGAEHRTQAVALAVRAGLI